MIRDQFVSYEDLSDHQRRLSASLPRLAEKRKALTADRLPVNDLIRWERNFTLLRVSYSIGDETEKVAEAASSVIAEIPRVEKLRGTFGAGSH